MINKISLNLYGGLRGDTKTYDKLALAKEIQDKMAAGQPVYVCFSDPRRDGSVGRLDKINFSISKGRSYYDDDRIYITVSDIEVVWDDRRNRVKPHNNEIYYLPDHQGGTSWAWEQTQVTKPAPIKAFDHLDQEIQVDQFVAFVHRKYGVTSLKFGTVSRINERGSVWVNALKLRDNDSVGEFKALAADDLIIVNEALMSRLVIARLAAQ